MEWGVGGGVFLRGVAGGPWTNSYLLPLQLYTELLLQTADYSGVRSLLGVTAASVRPSKLYTTWGLGRPDLRVTPGVGSDSEDKHFIFLGTSRVQQLCTTAGGLIRALDFPRQGEQARAIKSELAEAAYIRVEFLFLKMEEFKNKVSMWSGSNVSLLFFLASFISHFYTFNLTQIYNARIPFSLSPYPRSPWWWSG